MSLVIGSHIALISCVLKLLGVPSKVALDYNSRQSGTLHVQHLTDPKGVPSIIMFFVSNVELGS